MNLARIKFPKEEKHFNPRRTYYAKGYRLEFYGCWKLSFRGKKVMQEKDNNFWEIVKMYDFLPYFTTDTVGSENLKLLKLEETHQFEEEDSNFIPSMGTNYEAPSKSNIENSRQYRKYKPEWV